MATKENRIYVVTNSNGIERLVEAAGKTSALAYAVKTTLTVELASQKDLVRLTNDGIEVESADGDGEQSGV